MFAIFLFILLIFSKTPVIKMFNLDIISPDFRTGPSGSLFGFAVVSSSTKQQWFYVGAPQALLARQRSTSVIANSTNTVPNGRLFGNVFECRNGTNECRAILSEDDLSQSMPSFHNVLDDAWLGSSVIATSNDSLVTCGYRLMRNISIDRYDSRGGCFKISADRRDISYYDFCEQSSETELLHEGSALCQSGLSLAYMPAGGGRSDIIAFGEPGAFQWSGRIEADYSDTLLRQLYVFKSTSSTPQPYSYLGYSVLIIKTKSRDMNDRSYIFIASAPRASNGRGEIRFFTKRFVSSHTFGYDTLQPIFHMNNNRSVPLMLVGEQTGSYFGHTLTAGDLNGDGHTDLVVSAPFFYSKKPSYGGAVYIYYGLNGRFSDERREILQGPAAESRFGFAVVCIPDLNKDGIDDLAVSAPSEKDDVHTGSVYIYLGSRTNKLMKFTQKIVPSQLLLNTKQTVNISDFGFSLSTQSPFNSPLSFSSSLSTSSNSTILIEYPSLIIGVPKANMVYNLRSHPLVNVNVQIENMKELQAIRYSTEDRHCKSIDGTPVVCFSVQICVESKDKLAQNLMIIYTLTADTLFTIGRILSNINHLPSVTTKQLVNTCENQTFFAKSGNDDFLTPIHFSLVYNVSQDRNELRSKTFLADVALPMINGTEDERTKKFQANFYKGCGNNDQCITDLQLTAEFVNGQNIISHHDSTSNLPVLGFDSEIRIRLVLANVPAEPNRRQADPAFGTKIDVYFPAFFVQFSQAIMEDKSYSCQPILGNHVRCKMTDFFNRPFPPEKISIIELIFTLSNVSLSNILRFDFHSTTLTNETNLENNNVALTAKVLLKTDLSLRAGHEPEQISLTGDGTLGLSSVKTIEQFGMEVTHVYTIINSGPNSVRSHNVTIYWPYETLDEQWEHGKLLLYLVDEPILEVSSSLSSSGTKIDGHCERLAQWRDHIHILDSLNRTSITNRKRRDEQNSENGIDSKASLATIITSPISSIMRSLTLSCDPNYQNVRCYPIYCHINSLSAQNYYFIKLRARLWNSTLIEEYIDKYDRIDIQSFASIHINDVLIHQTSTDNDNATATTPVEFANRSDKIIVPRLPLWVPLVGAMAGLILLVFIVIVCCLLGFFQRTKAPPIKKKPTALPLDGTTTNSSSDEHQRILLRQAHRQQTFYPSSTTNSFNEDNFLSQQTTIPLIHSIPEVPSADNPDIDEDEEDDDLVHNNLGNQSDIEEEARFPVEYDDDEYSSKMNEPLVDVESINQSVK
ncbi:unnamed protein product [Adineta ricciae]|uniref:Uncharacterized protein n=1 Tax=Adineta ricciae TaxID=249248 RepID=A0A814MY97_ADIRI|nr:unnamed protein product [Adineta ricciae]